MPTVSVSLFTDKGSLQFVPQNSPKAIYGEIVQNEYIRNNPRGKP